MSAKFDSEKFECKPKINTRPLDFGPTLTLFRSFCLVFLALYRCPRCCCCCCRGWSRVSTWKSISFYFELNFCEINLKNLKVVVVNCCQILSIFVKTLRISCWHPRLIAIVSSLVVLVGLASDAPSTWCSSLIELLVSTISVTLIPRTTTTSPSWELVLFTGSTVVLLIPFRAKSAHIIALITVILFTIPLTSLQSKLLHCVYLGPWKFYLRKTSFDFDQS